MRPTLYEEIPFDSEVEAEDIGTVRIVDGKATRSQNIRSGNKFTRYAKARWVCSFCSPITTSVNGL